MRRLLGLLLCGRAAALYFAASPTRKPMIITTSRGTPHKPSPRDSSGFMIPESEMNARALMALA